MCCKTFLHLFSLFFVGGIDGVYTALYYIGVGNDKHTQRGCRMTAATMSQANQTFMSQVALDAQTSDEDLTTIIINRFRRNETLMQEVMSNPELINEMAARYWHEVNGK